MPVQRFNGSFPPIINSTPPNYNLWDGSLNPAYQAGRTPGATLIEQLQLVPPFTQKWTLLAISITAHLVISTPTICCGKLGKITAGIVPQFTTPAPTIAAGGIQQPPADQSCVSDLWDPASDPLPPQLVTGGPAQPLPITASLQLPQPIEFDQSEVFGVGIWMYPSLIVSQGTGLGFLLIVRDAGFSVIYDDGLPG